MRKNKREPIRCAKCQHYGHIARECITHHDSCANCAEHHRTSECTNRDHTCCISCESNNHASWDRRCPEFECRCSDLDARDADNTIPYFLTDETWTHAQEPPKPNPYKKPPRNNQHEPPHCTQDTIEGYFAPKQTINSRGSQSTRGCYLPPQSRISSRHSNPYSHSRSQTPAATSLNHNYV